MIDSYIDDISMFIRLTSKLFSDDSKNKICEILYREHHIVIDSDLKGEKGPIGYAISTNDKIDNMEFDK